MTLDINKKKKERFFVSKFLKTYLKADFLDLIDYEHPDFILKYCNCDIGIELSRLYIEKENGKKFPPQEKEGLRQAITHKSENEFKRMNDIPLHVGINFKNDINCDQKRKKELPKLIADRISIALKDFDLKEITHISLGYHDKLPPEINGIDVSYFPNIRASVWYPPYAWIVPEINQKLIRLSVKKKESDLLKYGDICKKYWLLLLELESPSSNFDNYSKIENEVFMTNFDEIFIYQGISDRIIKLKISKDTMANNT